MRPRLPGWLHFVRDAEHARRAALLARTPVFANLSRRLIGRLAAQLFEKSYAAGETVFHEGDPGKGLFVVLEGEVEVVRQVPAAAGAPGEVRLATFGPGASFGELALIDDQPRSATARVTAPTRLLILYRTHFEGLVEGDRAIALAVTRNLLRLLASYVRTTTARAAAATPPAPAPPGTPEPAPPPPAAASDRPPPSPGGAPARTAAPELAHP
jgi:CRP-like cAMP-binding protein